MLWIKRNLFFVIGGVVALALLGAAGYYDYKSWSQNSEQLAKLHEIYQQLKDINDPKQITPNQDNISLAKTQEAQVRDWIKQASSHFAPIPPIPDTGANAVDSEQLGATLRATILQLESAASNANVTIPPKYCFSFEAEAGTRQMIMKYAANSLAMIPVQLGEVKAITDIIFAAHVNALDSIQRVRISEDDLNAAANGATGNDYVDSVSTTNATAVITPYVITFRCFSQELAGVVSGFASSPNGFVVSNLSVQQAGAADNGGAPAYMGGGRPTFAPFQPAAVTAEQVMAPKGMPIVLKDKILRVTMEVKIVKPLTK